MQPSYGAWDIKDPQVFQTFLFVAQFLTYLNSALNPCLYFIFIENYRRGLKRVLSQASSRLGNDRNRTTRAHIDSVSQPPNKYMELTEIRTPLTPSEEQSRAQHTINAT